MFDGSLRVTALPVEHAQLPHGVAVTPSEHQKAQLQICCKGTLNAKKIQTKVEIEFSVGLDSCFAKPAIEEKKMGEWMWGAGGGREAEKKAPKSK